ncbi:acyltransferase family protein [Bacteroides sp.]|uniref:acyltransferase family protein n=1 Tax=Bacteroides sp. TaxID=29523 RepID=UPI00258BA1F2|nr:acyltransferase family protein [Bacteroides sp.]
MNNQRLLYIDYVKGIAILLLLLSHTIPGYGMIKTWIFAFHMLIFFIVCGILIQLKYSNKGIFNTTNYLKKRYNNIFKPYLFFGLLLFLFYNCINIYYQGGMVYSHLINLLTLQGIDSLWFLPVYFFSEFIFLLLNNKIKLDIRINGIIVLIIFLFFQFGREDIPPFLGQMERMLIGYVFIYVGYICARFKIIDNVNMMWAIILLFCASLSACLNEFSSMFTMNNPFFFFINAIGISIAIMAVCHNCEKRGDALRINFLSFWGANSIMVLCTNNILIETIRLLDYKITGNMLLNMGLLGGFLFFFLLIPIMWFVVFFMEKKMGFLFGR